MPSVIRLLALAGASLAAVISTDPYAPPPCDPGFEISRYRSNGCTDPLGQDSHLCPDLCHGFPAFKTFQWYSSNDTCQLTLYYHKNCAGPYTIVPPILPPMPNMTGLGDCLGPVDGDFHSVRVSCFDQS